MPVISECQAAQVGLTVPRRPNLVNHLSWINRAHSGGWPGARKIVLVIPDTSRGDWWQMLGSVCTVTLPYPRPHHKQPSVTPTIVSQAIGNKRAPVESVSWVVPGTMWWLWVNLRCWDIIRADEMAPGSPSRLIHSRLPSYQPLPHQAESELSELIWDGLVAVSRMGIVPNEGYSTEYSRSSRWLCSLCMHGLGARIGARWFPMLPIDTVGCSPAAVSGWWWWVVGG